MKLSELILNLRAAAKSAKENSSIVLRDTRGFWKPAHHTIDAAISELERTEKFVQEIDAILSANFGSNSTILAAVKYARDQYEAAEEPALTSLAEAKRRLNKKEEK